MKSIYLLLLSLNLNAQVVTWNEVKDVKGYRLYWSHVNNCNDLVRGDFIHSVNVGDNLKYNIFDDYNFHIGELYQVRLTAYDSRGVESLQSKVVACFEITGMPDQITEIKINQGEKNEKNINNNKPTVRYESDGSGATTTTEQHYDSGEPDNIHSQPDKYQRSSEGTGRIYNLLERSTKRSGKQNGQPNTNPRSISYTRSTKRAEIYLPSGRQSKLNRQKDFRSGSSLLHTRRQWEASEERVGFKSDNIRYNYRKAKLPFVSNNSVAWILLTLLGIAGLVYWIGRKEQ